LAVVVETSASELNNNLCCLLSAESFPCRNHKLAFYFLQPSESWLGVLQQFMRKEFSQERIFWEDLSVVDDEMLH
jgi:hypothetical protein